jgi:hypothetical protein
MEKSLTFLHWPPGITDLWVDTEHNFNVNTASHPVSLFEASSVYVEV